MVRSDPRIERVQAAAYTVPTDAPESDGTLDWDHTTLVACEVTAGGRTGLGYTYAAAAAARLLEDQLRAQVEGRSALDVAGAWEALARAVRNVGRPGVASMAIAAVDVALWDLKAKLLEVPLVALLGAVRDAVPAYGSGGFTSYPVGKLEEQLAAWVERGLGSVKMKVGRDPAADPARVHAARQAVGADARLMVDANGAYDAKQALALAERFAADGVRWFEEPVPSDDLAGLGLLRGRLPPGMEVAAGEYGQDLVYFRRMLAAGAVDVLQIDATRAGGVTGFVRAAALAQAHGLPVSAHTAPALHAHVCCAVPNARDVEYFHDHVRVEQLLFDGALAPVDGRLRPDRARPGLGLELKRVDGRRYLVAH